MRKKLAVIAVITGVASGAASAQTTIQYRQHPTLGMIQACRFELATTGAPAKIPASLAQDRKSMRIAGPGETVSAGDWVRRMQISNGPATAVLKPTAPCPYQIVIAYSTDASGTNASKVAEAGTAIPLACLPAGDRQDAIRRTAEENGPTGRTMLVGISRKYKDGTYQSSGTYDWDAIRRLAVATQNSPTCVTTHADLPVPH